MEKEISENDNVHFYVATDSHKVEAELKSRYQERIITYEKTSVSRKVESGIQDAVIDLYNLSKTKKIYGSIFSTFSYTAAKIGGIDLIRVK